jgi:hypothetical protein
VAATTPGRGVHRLGEEALHHLHHPADGHRVADDEQVDVVVHEAEREDVHVDVAHRSAQEPEVEPAVVLTVEEVDLVDGVGGEVEDPRLEAGHAEASHDRL